MVNYVNFSTRMLPSVDYGRRNVWARQQQHAINATNAALANCGCSSGLGGFGFTMPMSMGFCYPMPLFGFGFPYCFPMGCGSFGRSVMTGAAIGASIGAGVSLIGMLFGRHKS